uniref:Uncharacterized protein n=1 Tax=Arundo donax TaxID=35708 RepID=A0A0A9BDN8_ARUDO
MTPSVTAAVAACRGGGGGEGTFECSGGTARDGDGGICEQTGGPCNPPLARPTGSPSPSSPPLVVRIFPSITFAQWRHHRRSSP